MRAEMARTRFFRVRVGIDAQRWESIQTAQNSPIEADMFIKQQLPALSLLLLACQIQAAEFDGWKAIRVAEQKGATRVLRTIDVTGDGISDLVVVNPRYSRLDVYRYRSPEQREGKLDDENLSDPKDANFLPLAIELQHQKIQLEQIPIDVIDVERDGERQLAVLVAAPTRLVILQRDESTAKWNVEKKFDLLGAEVTARHKAMQLSPSLADDGAPSVLIACEEGYMRVKLGEEIRSDWLKPREQRTLLDWWVTDVDGDGNHDILEQRRSADEAICWLQGDGKGEFQPARVLHDRQSADVRVLGGFAKSSVVVLDARAEGMVRRFELDSNEISPLGRMLPLPIEDGAVWGSLWQGDRRVLVTASNSSPLLNTFLLTEDGWKAGATFPTIGNVLKIVQPPAIPGTLLLWCKDANSLYKTTWDGSRLSYPKMMTSNEKLADDAQVLGLGQVGKTVWWATQNDRDILLHLMPNTADEPIFIKFAGIGSSAEDVRWIGGKRLLVKERRARGLVLVEQGEEGSKPSKSEPASLQRAELEEFRTYEISGETKVGRLTDGALQWLDEGLEPFEQVMLGDSQEIADLLPETLSSGWAVDSVSGSIHRLQPDETGVAKEVARYEVAGTESIVMDHVLGLVAVGRNRIVSLSEGTGEELQQVEALDQRTRRVGANKGDCDRFLVVDLDLDGKEELLLCDDEEHTLTALRLGDSFETILSWKVFEDMAYPYGGDDFGGDGSEAEPRAIASLDLDGDSEPDLAMLSHDRLLIYFGNEPK